MTVLHGAVLRVAAAAYPVDYHAGPEAYEAKLSGWVADAAAQGAQLLVFPEYAALELVSLLPPELHHDLDHMRSALQALLPDFLALHTRLAREHGVGIVAGSYPTREGLGFVNRAFVFGPDGTFGYQDKLLMTRFEAEEWHIDPGHGTHVFELPLEGGGAVRFGVAICYDAEFPALARRLAEGGAELLVVPSFTATPHGYTRVRVGGLARALENQCYALHAPLIARADWSYAVETAVGRAALYSPSDLDLPEDGLVAQGEWNTPGWLIHDLDLTLTRRVREEGHVLNWRDRHAALERPGEAELVRLAAPAPTRG